MIKIYDFCSPLTWRAHKASSTVKHVLLNPNPTVAANHRLLNRNQLLSVMFTFTPVCTLMKCPLGEVPRTLFSFFLHNFHHDKILQFLRQPYFLDFYVQLSLHCFSYRQSATASQRQRSLPCLKYGNVQIQFSMQTQWDVIVIVSEQVLVDATVQRTDVEPGLLLPADGARGQ